MIGGMFVVVMPGNIVLLPHCDFFQHIKHKTESLYWVTKKSAVHDILKLRPPSPPSVPLLRFLGLWDVSILYF